MPQQLVGLLGGSYLARSFLASAQTRGNLYGEALPQIANEPVQYAQYLRPGLTLIGNAPTTICRCIYRATNGDGYACYGQNIYYLAPAFDIQGNLVQISPQLVGTMEPTTLDNVVPAITPISMTDNGTNILISDNSVRGWTITMATRNGFAPIDINALSIVANSANTVSGGVGYVVGDVLTVNTSGGCQIEVLSVDSNGVISSQEVIDGGQFTTENPGVFGVTGGTGSGASFTMNYTTSALQEGWLGSPRVGFVNTFFTASEPGTPLWYVSDSNSINFDPVQFADNTSTPDPIVAVVPVKTLIWILCKYSYQIWITNSNLTIVNQFPFIPFPQAFGDWGVGALYSVSTSNNQLFWLAQDNSGKGVVYRGDGLNSAEISNPAVANTIQSYPKIDDCVSYCYQLDNHLWYVMNFPSANNGLGATWVWDNSNSQWHEEFYTDRNGIRSRHRVQCAMEMYGAVVGGDYLTGAIYKFDLNNFTDNGMPIVKTIRSPHLMDAASNNRIRFTRLIANFQVGSASSSAIPAQFITNSTFDAPDGTLLQNYDNPFDLNSDYTFLSGSTNIEILDDKLVGAATGNATYQIGNNGPPIADYVLKMNISISNSQNPPVNSASAFLIGRAVNGNGYQAKISSNGTVLSSTLNVMNTAITSSVVMGAPIQSGFYTMTLSMQGTSISMYVYRSTDNTYLIPTGSWGAVYTPCISISDGTYADIGEQLLGGNWL